MAKRTYFHKDTGEYLGSYNGPEESLPLHLQGGHRVVPGWNFNKRDKLDLQTGRVVKGGNAEARRTELAEREVDRDPLVKFLMEEVAALKGVAPAQLRAAAVAHVKTERTK